MFMFRLFLCFKLIIYKWLLNHVLLRLKCTSTVKSHQDNLWQGRLFTVILLSQKMTQLSGYLNFISTWIFFFVRSTYLHS